MGDKKWKKGHIDKGSLPNPNIPPQSHLVNSRTSTEWYHELDDKIIQGRIQYFSLPVTLVIGPEKSVTHELSQRINGHHHRTEEEIEEIIDVSFIFIGFSLTCVVLGSINYFKAKQEAMTKNADKDIMGVQERPSTRPYVKVVSNDDENEKEVHLYPAYTDYTDKVPNTKKEEREEDEEEDDDDMVEENIIELM